MSGNHEVCKRCDNPFGPDRLPDQEYPHLCEDCVYKAKMEMMELDDVIENEALKYGIFTNRCPEL